MEQLLKLVMEPCFFSLKDSSLATIAKISREFGDEFEGPFMEKKMSKALVRHGVVNITVDTKKQKEACLMVNFGVETECLDLVPYSGIHGQELLDMLSNAQRELVAYNPPIPTLECSYREFKTIGRLSVTKVVSKQSVYISKNFIKGILRPQSS